MNKPVIICVDDEKIILDSLKLEIKASFKELLTIETAESASEALSIINECIAQGIDIPIVISDWLMPEVKGDEFLSIVHKLLPDTMKILLTGQVTTSGLGNAINKAKLYRFIPKPWHSEDLDLTITEAFKSYYNKLQLKNANAKLKEMNSLLEDRIRTRTAELEESNKRNQILLDQTLIGSINALIKILMKSNPEIFEKAYRIRTYSKRILKNLTMKNLWEIEIACLFSQIGCIDLPYSIKTKITHKEKLNKQELSVFNLHPQKTYELLSNIPIFGNIAQGILDHFKPVSQLENNDSYFISAILKIASDFDELIQAGYTESETIEIIKNNEIIYDKSVLNALIKDINIAIIPEEVQNPNEINSINKINYKDEINDEDETNDILKIELRELMVGLVLAKDIVDMQNNIIYKAEEEITHSVLANLLQISQNMQIKEPIFVYNYLLL